MHLSLSANGESDLAFVANTWIIANGDKVETKDGSSDFSVGTYSDADKKFDVTVYGKIEAGDEGSTMKIEFCACQSNTIWTYEWHEMAE